MTAFTTIEIDEFKITGIAVRTTNENGQSQKDIGSLWGKFFSENIGGQIPDKETNDIYCIYTDYKSDFNGEYTTIIGCRVHSFDNLRDGFISKTIPASKYQVYKSTGELPLTLIFTDLKLKTRKMQKLKLMYQLNK